MKVSVIIPTFNRAAFLKEAIDSVLSQSYQDFELIVVDDGSTDLTQDVIREYPELTYIHQGNQGVSAARNRGLQVATGEYVAFLDSDDLWVKEKLQVQMTWMEANPDSIACYTDEIWIRRGKRVNPMKKHQKYSGWIFDKCLPLCIISPSSILMHRALFQKVGLFDENLPVCEDYDLWLRIAKDYPIHFIPMSLIIKRGGHPDQLSHKSWGNDRFRVKALEKLIKSGRLTDTQREMVLGELKRKCEILAKGCMKRGKTEEADGYYEKIDRVNKI
jgi:glycosyltransferase involved in cell wall biosynthesis